MCASVDGEEGSRRAGHKVGGRYIGGGWKGTRRVCEGGGGKERRRVVVSKETRTPGGKNGSARVRKEERKVEGFQISRDRVDAREREREEKGWKGCCKQDHVGVGWSRGPLLPSILSGVFRTDADGVLIAGVMALRC